MLNQIVRRAACLLPLLAAPLVSYGQTAVVLPVTQ
jgi:hypothetical protein